jgi:hypothetical protein
VKKPSAFFIFFVPLGVSRGCLLWVVGCIWLIAASASQHRSAHTLDVEKNARWLASVQSEGFSFALKLPLKADFISRLGKRSWLFILRAANAKN